MTGSGCIGCSKHGIHNHVLDAASLLVSRRARPAKTDRIDAERLLRALIRYLRGEREACSVVNVPRVEEEDARRLHRERKRLVAEHVQQGIYDYEPLRKNRLSRLDELRTGDGRPFANQLVEPIAFLRVEPDHVFLDGNLFPGHESPPSLPCCDRDSEIPVMINDGGD